MLSAKWKTERMRGEYLKPRYLRVLLFAFSTAQSHGLDIIEPEVRVGGDEVRLLRMIVRKDVWRRF